MHPTLAAFAASYRHRYPDLEATIEATHKVLDGAGVTWSLGNEATRLPLAKRAEFAAEPDTLPNVTEARVIKIAEANGYKASPGGLWLELVTQ